MPNVCSDEEFREKLSPQQYKVLREKGTEAPFSGKYYKENRDGVYHCAACGQRLFSSDAKFESGSGWPSFDRPENMEHVTLQPDDSHGMHRVEVLCKNCGSHLGHVFEDGPKETTGQRYCINSIALDFQPKKE